MYSRYIKRILDLTLSFAALLILSPLFLIAYVAVRLDSSGPFFFFQERLGKGGLTFKVYKIRTMTNKPRISEKEVYKDDPEVTQVGRILRRLKFDELPQLINVLRGEMSIVGPRPGLTNQQQDFNEDGRMRLMTRPGLTGLAQVNGNIYLSWPERWKYDRLYVENISLLLDIKIIFKTILILVKGEEKFLTKPDV